MPIFHPIIATVSFFKIKKKEEVTLLRRTKI